MDVMEDAAATTQSAVRFLHAVGYEEYVPVVQRLDLSLTTLTSMPMLTPLSSSDARNESSDVDSSAATPPVTSRQRHAHQVRSSDRHCGTPLMQKLDIQNRNSFCPAEPADSTIDFYFAIVKRTPLSDN